MRGIVYIAFGRNAIKEADLSIRSLKKVSRLPVRLIKGSSSGVLTNAQLARSRKTDLLNLSPYEETLFLDADTRIHQNPEVGFRALSEGWELVIVPSLHQDAHRPLWHLKEEEREFTFQALGTYSPMMLNSGVMFFRKCDRVANFFKLWHEEWLRFKDKDQGALLRALHRHPLAVWLLGSAFNGGEVIEHLFGRAV